MLYLHFSLILLFSFQIIAYCSMNKVGALNANTDKQALLSFKSMISDPQNALSGWIPSSSHCTWFGVNCTNKGERVQSLRLSRVGLSGIIPPHLSNLTSLRTLNLYDNKFYGQIPPDFGKLSNLQSIILGRNSINDTIPASLSRCNNLEEIALQVNQIPDNLPPELGYLPKLKVLDVSINNLTGAIPPTLGNLSSLTHLILARNQLSGRIPLELGRLQNLLYLHLSENQLIGEIPPSIFNISSLDYVSLTKNQLSGELPINMGVALPNMRELYLAHNNLEGPIPTSLSNASQMRFLDLSSNGFQGPVPLLGKMNNLVRLHLGTNNLSSTTQLNFQLIDSLKNCTLLEILFMNANHLSGELPNSIANLSTNLLEFCVPDNYLTGSILQGFENYRNLTAISIHNNFFTGEIPNSIGQLQQLRKLTIQENKLSGQIPDIFGNFTQLYMVRMGDNQFSGRIPTSIAKCQHLNMVGLAWNRLNGSIPKEIFELPSLNTLLLESNALTGPLPIEVGGLKQLEIMDVSENQLTGSIPTTIDGCSSLRSLNMARNNINGSIPDSLGKLVALESLDLSSNSLSASIPQDIQNLRGMQNLNFSFNLLEGEVPRGGVFMNLGWDSLQGNHKLCVTDQEAAAKLRLITCVTKKKSDPQVLLKVLTPILGLIVLMCAIFCLMWALITQKKKKRTHRGSASSPTMELLPNISYFEIQLATDRFAADNLIGKGGFGSVYKGVFSAGENGVPTTLAIKVFDLGQGKTSKSFHAECEALRNVRHRNLVKVFTSCSGIDHEGGEFKALVMEFMSNGNLDNWLYSEDIESGSSLTLTQRLNIAIDVASAMDYLHHDCEPPVVHCDLKPGNVLLDDDMTAHVGDFGLARFLSQNSLPDGSNTVALKGSVGYIAPEYGMGGKASTSGDVYSFGILLLEMFIAKRPTDEIFREGLTLNKFASAVHEKKVWEILDPRLLNSYNELAQSSSNGHSSGAITTTTTATASSSSSSSSNAISIWLNKSEECFVAVIRIGLMCAVHSAKDRLTMREALTKLYEIKKVLRNDAGQNPYIN